MNKSIVGLAITLALFLIASFLIKLLKLRFTKFSYKKRASVMTEAEKKIFRKLQQQYGDQYYIFPQINLNKLIAVTSKTNYYHHFNKINQKSVDFVLANKETLETIKIIELDDYTHRWKSRKKRDEFVNYLMEAVKLPIQHFKE